MGGALSTTGWAQTTNPEGVGVSSSVLKVLRGLEKTAPNTLGRGVALHVPTWGWICACQEQALSTQSDVLAPNYICHYLELQ